MNKDGDVPGTALGPRFDCRATGSLIPIYGKDVIKAQMPDAVAELLGIPRGLILDRFRVKFNEFVDRSWPFYERGPLRQMVERRDFVTSVPTGVRLKFERALLFLDIFRDFNASVMLEGPSISSVATAPSVEALDLTPRLSGSLPKEPVKSPPGPQDRASVAPVKRRRGRPTNVEVRAREMAEFAARAAKR